MKRFNAWKTELIILGIIIMIFTLASSYFMESQKLNLYADEVNHICLGGDSTQSAGQVISYRYINCGSRG